MGERIGGGGMAEVFAGEIVGAEGFVREVAIKRMRPELCQQRGFGRLFVREARLASMLVHPNIVSVLDFDQDAEGNHFLVMERVRGVDLHRLMSTGAVPIAIAVFIVCEILRGLAHAHELSHDGESLCIVHRDVSPHNVMLATSGAVKLVDFGVARARSAAYPSLAGSLESMPGVLGKVAYMSPEQVHGVELDGRSDVFSAGILLHELLTARRLFAAPTPVESVDLVLRKKIASPRADNPEVSHELADVCLRMLVRDRRSRFASARQAWRALDACASTPGSAGLARLLRERFPTIAREREAHAPVLSAQTVPLTPSLVMPGSTEHQLVHVATRTAPTPRAATTAGHASNRGSWPRLLVAVLPLAAGLGYLASAC